MAYRGDRPPCQTRPRQSSQSPAPPSYPENKFLSKYGSRVVSEYGAGRQTGANNDEYPVGVPAGRRCGSRGGGPRPGFAQEEPHFWIAGGGIMADMSMAKSLHLAVPGTGEADLPETTPNKKHYDAAGRSSPAKQTCTNPALPSFKRGATLQRKRSSAATPLNPTQALLETQSSCLGDHASEPKGPWMLYRYLLTACIPTPMMRACGLKSFEQQRAWHDKMGLMSIVLGLMGGMGFITFRFTQPFHGGAIGDGNIGKGSVVINGYDYDFGSFSHLRAGTMLSAGKTNPLWNLAGNVASFLLQNVNQHCLGLVWDDEPESYSSVLNLELLAWLDPSQITYPAVFDEMKVKGSPWSNTDLTMLLIRPNEMQLGHCLQDMITTGFIDMQSIGCVASQVLSLSLIFIVAGKFPKGDIEAWSNDLYTPAPSGYQPNVDKGGLRKGERFLPSTSRFRPGEGNSGKGERPTTAYAQLDSGSSTNYKCSTLYAGSIAPSGRHHVVGRRRRVRPARPGHLRGEPLPDNVVPQPPPDYEPFNFHLAHTICLATAYSVSVEGLRTTLDSLATTDYLNSHKLIMVIADGMVKGDAGDLFGDDEEVCGFVVPPGEVVGYYAYDDATTERSKQQRVPIVLVAKYGNLLEADDGKPGDLGKRDSQIVLMTFLRKFAVEGDGGESRPVFPGSLTRMVSCVVHDEEIMGLCGETKIATKAEMFVTMMQVFEYYISHHTTKAFESRFGGVTCLPGCFSMYRIKAAKGKSWCWVPILANPDIVERYSENVIDMLHKKNLFLLGEDRYLTTLMLKPFPKRKNMFCPQAVCQPDTFRVLLSQRRRWVSSMIHNLVGDLCGMFCFSMQFVMGMELAGTLVLPAALTSTLYLIIASILPHHANTTVPLVLFALLLGLPLVLIYLLTLSQFGTGSCRRMRFGSLMTFRGGRRARFRGIRRIRAMRRATTGPPFERERRWKSEMQSCDSDEHYNRYGQLRCGTAPGPRLLFHTLHPHHATRSSCSPPLAVSRHTTASAGSSNPMSSTSSVGQARSRETGFDAGGSANRLIPSPQTAIVDQWNDAYDVPGAVRLRPRRARGRSASTAPPGSTNPFMLRGVGVGGPGIPVLCDEPEAKSAARSCEGLDSEMSVEGSETHRVLVEGNAVCAGQESDTENLLIQRKMMSQPARTPPRWLAPRRNGTKRSIATYKRTRARK
ncbi:glycosyltransferase family 2 protein [Mycena crocata]|nr:glycosyltransferase family 2 protein [Mycena crocata]